MSRATEIFLAMHEGSWIVLVILFVLSLIMFMAGKDKVGKIASMVLRLFFIIMIVSGIGVLVGYDFPLVYIIKGILALLLIGFMEMALGKAKRKASALVPLLLVVIALVVVVLMGYGVITF